MTGHRSEERESGGSSTDSGRKLGGSEVMPSGLSAPPPPPPPSIVDCSISAFVRCIPTNQYLLEFDYRGPFNEALMLYKSKTEFQLTWHLDINWKSGLLC